MKKILYILVSLSITGFVLVLALGGYTIYQVVSGSHDHLKKEKIIEILSRETLLFYDDGQTQLGSLFGQEHRIYVPIDEVPKIMQDAIISAEDESFYHNIGIDFKSTLRAAINNMISSSRQGASTISQQTVKNLYGREKTNLYTKYVETINALKLERLYSKKQILEFYLNQFHVTGNGRGIGIAAKYYFNTEVHDLSLVQAAFIAGSVKGPEKYDPFTKTSK
ncbi:MAG: transglycosylase domain-containing protein, partial [Silvanigrellaceae bacterium]|nr:transglycosylase domain-containing protein [Silvanigrellaceae bacterium]